MTADYFLTLNQPIKMGSVFNDICSQLDSVIVKCVMLIAFGYIFNMLVINRSLEYWKNPDSYISKSMPTDLILKGVQHLKSLLETLFLGACLVVLWVAYTQEMLGFWSYFLLCILAFFVSLIGIVEIMKYVKKWRFKKLKK